MLAHSLHVEVLGGLLADLADHVVLWREGRDESQPLVVVLQWPLSCS